MTCSLVDLQKSNHTGLHVNLENYEKPKGHDIDADHCRQHNTRRGNLKEVNPPGLLCTDSGQEGLQLHGRHTCHLTCVWLDPCRI